MTIAGITLRPQNAILQYSKPPRPRPGKYYPPPFLHFPPQTDNAKQNTNAALGGRVLDYYIFFVSIVTPSGS